MRRAMRATLSAMSEELVTQQSNDLAVVGAYEAIENVSTAEEAEQLLLTITIYQKAAQLAQLGNEQVRRWDGLRLRAERKMGELLGSAVPGGKQTGNKKAAKNRVTAGHTVSDEERKAQERARKVAAVPDEVFAEYIEATPEPTRAGLLRAVAPPKPKKKPDPEPPLWHHLPDMLPGATREGAFRHAVVTWFQYERELLAEMEDGVELVPKATPDNKVTVDEDREALLLGLSHIRETAERLERQLRNDGT